MTDISKIDEILEPYLEEDELLVDDEYDFDKDSRVLTFKVDIITDEIDVVISFLDPAGAKVEIGDYKTTARVGTIEEILKKVMNQIVSTRDQNLDFNSPHTPSSSIVTPGGGWDEFDPFRHPEQDSHHVELVETPISPEFSALYYDCDICRRLFGRVATSVVKGTQNVRLTVFAKYMTNEIRLKYGISELTSVTFSLNFQGKQYMKVAKSPHVGGSFSENAYGEQVLNIARAFVARRWEIIQTKINPPKLIEDAGLFFIEREIHRLADHSTLKYRRELAKKDLIKKYIREKQEEYALALCLVLHGMNISDSVNEFVELGGKMIDEKDVEFLRDLKTKNINFPVEVLTYLTLRMPTITQHCSICDGYVFCQIDQKMPTVCTNFKCQFDYITQKRCASITQNICPQTICQDLKDNPNIVDILISLCYVACKHNRKDIIFKPFPPMYLKNEKKDFDALYKCFERVPSVDDMAKHAKNEMSLKGHLGMEVYELVQWILSVKRVAMVRMTKEKKIKEMTTEFQYMLLVDDPKKTKRFEKDREKYGSFFAFHGSGLQNWHSILRRGLLVGSGTDLQTTGAAFGQGIYMSNRSATSMGYSRQGNSWPKSKFGETGVKLIAVCEVVKGPDVPTKPNPHYVINHPQFVTCRFLLWYSSGTHQNSMNLDDVDLHNQYLDGKGKVGTDEIEKKKKDKN